MGVCTYNRSYPRNEQTTISINYSPTYYNINTNNTKDDFNSFKEEIVTFPIQKSQACFINNNIDINSDIDNLNKQYTDLKSQKKLFSKNIKEQEKCIYNYKSYISYLYYQKNVFKNNSNISVIEEEYYQNLFLSNNGNNDLLINIQNVSNKINEFNDLLDNQKNQLKNLQNSLENIQEQFYDINKPRQNNPSLKSFMVFTNINSIRNELTQNEIIIKNLEFNQIVYNAKKTEIENDLRKIQSKVEEKEKLNQNQNNENYNIFSNIENNNINNIISTNNSYINNNILKKPLYLNKDNQIDYTNNIIKNNPTNKNEINNSFYLHKNNKTYNHNNNIIINNQINDSSFLRSSLLLIPKDLSKIKNDLKPINLFNQDESQDTMYNQPNLLKKNWQETCYIKNNFDIYDINYTLKAVGLPENMNYTWSFLDFDPESKNKIEITTVEIDGKKVGYKYENYSLVFNVLLKNLESSNIHIKYKESPLYEKMTEGEKEIRKIFRCQKYGLDNILEGITAKFILINESNFEIINFDDEIFIKIRKNEYQWGGVVPKEGKKTLIRMSKKEAQVNFYEKHEMKTIDNSLITNIVTKIPFCYMDGNNKIIKYDYKSSQTKKIRLDKKTKVFEVKFTHIFFPVAEFSINGILNNRCKGEWIINLSNKEIESLIPPDFRTNKEEFKRIANEIIKQYDEEHKNDLVLIPNVAKIGKWINKNIKYDLYYKNFSELTATETLKQRRGICHHFTKLFNAFMYSLGYQVIYILGYAIEKKTSFSLEDAHAWSLIKIEGKWLPFDATWGIFSGKLPVTHIFKEIGGKKIKTMSSDKIKIEQIFVQGKIS